MEYRKEFWIPAQWCGVMSVIPDVHLSERRAGKMAGSCALSAARLILSRVQHQILALELDDLKTAENSGRNKLLGLDTRSGDQQGFWALVHFLVVQWMRPRYKGRRAIALKLFVKVKEKTGMDFSLADDIITKKLVKLETKVGEIGNNWQWLTTSGWVEGGSLAYYLQHKRKEVPHLTQHVTKRGKAGHPNERVERPEVVRTRLRAGSAGSAGHAGSAGNRKRKPEARSGSRKLNSGIERGGQEGERGDIWHKPIWQLATSEGPGTCRFREYGSGVRGGRGSNMVTVAGREEGGGRTTNGTDPMSCGHEAHRESLEVGSGARIRIRGLAKDADTLDGSDRPDGSDVERAEVMRMGWKGSSDGLDTRGKGPDPRTQMDRMTGWIAHTHQADDWTDCKDIEWTEVDQMGQACNRRINWSQGLSNGLEVREKGPDPRFGRGRRQMWRTQQIVQSRRVDRSQMGTAEVGHPP
ncbi:hypothetical protein B0H14DRAFT_2638118 [Mycena olivaceomarginata]|nr:hypothetical protein B0H14DRAFT_2638118 [Mycena olivaceomarginata]